MLENTSVPLEDKQNIRALLKKPWNPYVVGRHATLTQKSRQLKEATLRVFAGWTPNSDMPKRYVHLFGNAACEDILEEYGLLDKGIKYQANLLRSKQCPNCDEPNISDSKFCNKCKMVLSYDAYEETLQQQEKREDRLTTIENQFNTLQSQIHSLLSSLGAIKDQNQVNQMAEALYTSGILREGNKTHFQK